MAFETIQIAPGIYHLQSGANTGLITSGNEAILIDAGLDDDTGRRIKKAVEALGLTITQLVITHAHADHFGGASYLRRYLPPFVVSAPRLEAAIVANPQLEGIALSGGAVSFDPLNEKFTLAPACDVDQIIAPGTNLNSRVGGELATVISLHGHSPQQIGVLTKNGEVLFCADAFLPLATLTKYPIPFTAHIGFALETLTGLDEKVRSGTVLAAGHGTHLSGDAARVVIEANVAALRRVIDATESALHDGPLTEADSTFAVAAALGDKMTTPVGYYLGRATIQAALVYLYEQKRAMVNNDGAGKMRWRLV